MTLHDNEMREQTEDSEDCGEDETEGEDIQ
jgi:hypothetical protein